MSFQSYPLYNYYSETDDSKIPSLPEKRSLYMSSYSEYFSSILRQKIVIRLSDEAFFDQKTLQGRLRNSPEGFSNSILSLTPCDKSISVPRGEVSDNI